MNWLDILLAIIFALSIISGLAKGFAREGIGFIAAVAGFVCGLWFYGMVAYYFLPYVSHKGVANFLGFLLIFLLMVLLGALAGKLLGLLFKWVGLSWLDRLLGGVFGVLRGFVFAIALIVALMAFAPKPPPQSVVESSAAPYLVGAAEICVSIAPNEVKEGVRSSYRKAKEIWSEIMKKGRARP